MQQHNLGLHKGEKYTQSWGFKGAGAQVEVRQFGKIILTWTKGPPETVSLDYQGWDSQSQANVLTAPRATWTF